MALTITRRPDTLVALHAIQRLSVDDAAHVAEQMLGDKQAFAVTLASNGFAPRAPLPEPVLSLFNRFSRIAAIHQYAVLGREFVGPCCMDPQLTRIGYVYDQAELVVIEGSNSVFTYAHGYRTAEVLARLSDESIYHLLLGLAPSRYLEYADYEAMDRAA